MIIVQERWNAADAARLQGLLAAATRDGHTSTGAALVLLPESIAAFRAARANRLQTSMNLALGSALASIGLTIPTLAVISIVMGWTLDLGLGPKEIVLLGLSLLVCTQSFSTGRTTVLQGTVHLVIFAVYLFTTIVP